MKLLTSIVLGMLTLFSGTLLARQEPPASQPVLVDVSDKAAVDAAMNKDVELEGVVRSATWNPKGSVFFVNFEKTEESKAMAVAFEKKREALDKSFSGDVGKALTGARVRIRGKLSDYKGKPQVIIDLPTQITILDPAPSTQPSSDKPAEK
ncbi:MAG: OB-fold nucleic acid binding domain-containing protein [Anaerolineae bacterium]|nr:OB-fold nucleic acid binding domain-containing protein [Phycisphaerae bacterium]